MSESAEEIRRKRVERIQAQSEQRAKEQREAQNQAPTPAPAPAATPTPSASTPTSTPPPPKPAAQPQAQPKEVKKPEKKETPQSSQSSTPKPQVPFEQWEDATIAETLGVTFNEDKKDQYSYLQDLKEELQSENEQVAFSKDILDRVIWSRIVDNQCLPAPFDYLWGSWNRAANARRMLRQNDPQYSQKKELLEEVSGLCLNYTVLVTTNPDMMPTPPNTGERLLAKANASPDPWEFFQACMIKAGQDETLVEFLTPILQHAQQDLIRRKGYCGDYKPHFALMEAVTSSKPAAAAVTEIGSFKVPENCAANGVATLTLLGPFLAVSPLSPDGALQNFKDADLISDAETQRRALDVHGEYKIIMQRLFDVCNKIVRAGAGARRELLKYFGQILDLNHKRKAMQVDPTQVATDGFMVNISYILTKLSEPFTDLYATKIDKIDFEYFKKEQHLLDISEETKVNADTQEANEFYQMKADTDPNFISHCFFLTCAYQHYGVCATMDSEDKYNRYVEQLEARVAELQAQPPNGPHAMMLPRLLENAKKQLTSARAYAKMLKTFMLFREFHMMTTQFALFQFVFLTRAMDPQHRYPGKVALPFEDEPEFFKHYPEYLVESPINYITTMMRVLQPWLVGLSMDPLIAFSVSLLRNSKFVKNPYLKSKLIEVLFFGSYTYRGEPGLLAAAFDRDQLCLDHLFHALMNFYIEVESTGSSSQFYDKFNTRFYISQIIKKIWSNTSYQNKLREESEEDVHFFVQFVALLLNDCTYLLDESLSKLQEIHRLQKELPPPPMPGAPEEDQETQEKRSTLASAEKHCRGYMQLTNQTVELFKLFTKAVPQAFITPEIVNRLSAMVNYNLEALVGPKCRELKVERPDRYGFNPRELLSALSDVYLNLSTHKEFQQAVARDGRSYKDSNFTRAREIMTKHGLKTPEVLTKWTNFAQQVKEIKEEDEQGEVELGEIPDEFQDPLMFSLMEDPVILPSSQVTIDKSTIMSHLLSDPKDPFNRSPLTLEDCIPDTDLKRRIEEFKQQRREEFKKNKMNVD